MQKKWPWPIIGYNVGQSVPIGMKFELDMWHYLLNVHTKFQIDISKCVKKSPETLESQKLPNHYENR